MIDDHIEVRKTLVRILEWLGYRVMDVGDGESGLTVIAEYADLLAVVIVDISLGLVSGVDVQQHVRQIYPSLPVILTSGYTTIDLTAVLAHDPLTRFLPKPFAPELLHTVIAELVAVPVSVG